MKIWSRIIIMKWDFLSFNSFHKNIKIKKQIINHHNYSNINRNKIHIATMLITFIKLSKNFKILFLSEIILKVHLENRRQLHLFKNRWVLDKFNPNTQNLILFRELKKSMQAIIRLIRIRNLCRSLNHW